MNRRFIAKADLQLQVLMVFGCRNGTGLCSFFRNSYSTVDYTAVIIGISGVEPIIEARCRSTTLTVYEALILPASDHV